MSLVDKMQERIERKKLQKRIDDVKDAYDEGDTKKEAKEKASNRVISLIEANPNMPVIQFFKMIQEEEELPTEILVEATKQIPNIKSEETTAKVVENLDFPSKGIQEIINETDVSLDTAKKMVAQIPDEVIQKEEKRRIEKAEEQRRIEQKKKEEDNIQKELKQRYSDYNTDISERTWIEDLKSIKEKNKSQKVKDMITRVLARMTAIDCKMFGNTRISDMAKIISAEEMLAGNFLELVSEEFNSIKDEDAYRGKKEYNQENLKEQILSEIAKDVAETYRKVGIIDIPQSENMKNLTKEQEDFLTRQILIYMKETKDEKKEAENITEIKKQIRGEARDYKKELQEIIEKIPEDEKKDYIETLKTQIQRGRIILLDSELEEKFVEVKERLKDLDIEDAMEILDETIEKAIEREKEERAEDEKQNNGTTQSDDDEYTH